MEVTYDNVEQEGVALGLPVGCPFGSHCTLGDLTEGIKGGKQLTESQWMSKAQTLDGILRPK